MVGATTASVEAAALDQRNFDDISYLIQHYRIPKEAGGKIVAGFRGENPQLIPDQKMREYRTAKNLPEPPPRQQSRAQAQAQGTPDWLIALKEGKPTYGDFLLAQPICDAVNLANISLRLGGKRLHWDAAGMKITNLPEANKYLTREYRKGWELTGDMPA